MQILEQLWKHGASSVREIQEHISGRKRLAATTVQTMITRLEAKKAVRRSGKVSGVFVFEAAIPRDAARRRLIDEFLAIFGGETEALVAHLVERGRLTPADVQEAEKHLRQLVRNKKRGKIP